MNDTPRTTMSNTPPPPPAADQKPEAASNAASCCASYVPLLQVKTTPGVPPRDEVEGWDELDRWARCNVGVWSAVQKRTDWSELMTDTDKLKLLASELLRQNLELFKEASEARMTNPARIIIQHNAPPTRATD